jgi:hypothetical protein
MTASPAAAAATSSPGRTFPGEVAGLAAIETAIRVAALAVRREAFPGFLLRLRQGLQSAAILEVVVGGVVNGAPKAAITASHGPRGSRFLALGLDSQGALGGRAFPGLLPGGIVRSANVFPGSHPPFFGARTLVRQGEQFGGSLDSAGAELLPHLRVAHVGVERRYRGVRGDVGNGVEHLAEALSVLPQYLVRLLDKGVEVTDSARTLVTSLERPYELIAEVRP